MRHVFLSTHPVDFQGIRFPSYSQFQTGQETPQSHTVLRKKYSETQATRISDTLLSSYRSKRTPRTSRPTRRYPQRPPTSTNGPKGKDTACTGTLTRGVRRPSAMKGKGGGFVWEARPLQAIVPRIGKSRQAIAEGEILCPTLSGQIGHDMPSFISI